MRLAPLLALAALLVITAIAPTMVSAQSLRCDGRLVSRGDTAHTLRSRCGEADFVAAYPVLEGAGIRVAATGGAADLVQEEVQWWTYVGKPGKFVRVVQIRRGKVQSVQVVNGVRNPEGSCEAVSDFRRGQRAGPVYVTCGAPVDRARWVERQSRERGDGVAVTRTVVRERWTYDPGPGRLLRVLEFENGELVSVKTSERSAR